MEADRKYPDVYIISKFTNLPTDLKKYLPENVKVIPVNISGLRMNHYELIQFSERTIEGLQKAEILVTDSHCLPSLIYRLPNVKWVQITLAGVEILMNELDPEKPLPNFTLTRFGDNYFGDLMANYVLAQIINVERKFFVYHDKQKEKIWYRSSVLPNFRVLSDLTVGILGSGSIGSAVGKLLKKSGSRVIAFVRQERNGASDSFDEASMDLKAVLKECDYICNVLPSTKFTRGLLDNDVLQNCAKKPVFINIGRGDVIQNSSIIRALRQGWISGAILDVVEKEPLPPDSELWNMPEVHITPHVGALPKCDGIAQFIAENYNKYIKGEPLMNVVSWKDGY